MQVQEIVIGSKIRFAREPEEYTVKACNERFVICVFIKRFVVHYTIIDLENKIRGPHNFRYNRYDFISNWYCEKCLKDLGNEISGVKISETGRKPLDIIYVNYPQD